MNVHEITLDVSKEPAHEPSLYIAQGDKNGTTLKASIYDDGASLSLSGKSARFCMKAPNGTGYYEVNGTVSGNVATFQIDETYAAAIHGVSEVAYVEILEGTTVICSTSRFRVVVLQSAQDGADPSQAWTNGVEEFLEDAQGQIDAAVDQAEDAAADALEAAEEAREAAGGTIPLMSPIQRGGAKLGHGLSMDGEVLNIGPLTDSGSGASVQTDGVGIFGVTGEGWAEQDTTTGKNLLPNNLVDATVSGVTFTKLPDGGIKVYGTETGSNSGTFIAQNLTLEPGAYTLSMSGRLVGNLRLFAYSSSTTTLYASLANGSKTFTVQSQDTVSVYFTSTGSNYQLEDTVIYPQLEAGSTATSYEPYTGGKASPSPDYPQEIRVARGHEIAGQTGRYVDLIVKDANDVVLSTTPIPLPSKGFAASLPDGTADALTVDSAGRWEWMNEMAQYVFDGDESWNKTPATTLDVFTYNFSASGIVMSRYYYGILSSHFVGGSVAVANRIMTDNGYINLTFASGTFADASGYKTWLTSNPVTVLYPLATPTTEHGYIELPELPAGATVSIPELGSIGVEWWVEGAEAIAEHGRDTSKAAHELSEKLSTLEAAVATLATS